MAIRTRWAGTSLLLMGLAAAFSGAGKTALADAPAAFGPVESRTFQFKPGMTTIEKSAANCASNADVLIMRGPNVANVKSIDVTPKTDTWDKNVVPITDCVAPNCLQLLVRVTNKDAVGPRTVTLKHADGRTTKTTFDVIENAGRCDYPQQKNK